jgi:membrane-associated phospholipid phosphatase
MAVAALVWGYRQVLGIVLGVLALCVGAARVLAHVHHTQDIVAGAMIGPIAATLATVAWRAVEPRVAARFDGTFTVAR